jgi:nascent polypeptide-associated complex subunit beta
MQNGSILHFTIPKIQTVVSANTYIISGNPEEKDIAELLPGILSQLGPENIAELRKMAQAFSKSEGNPEVNGISEKLENTNTD